MARPARGQEAISRAREALKRARTVEELRQAQAVILPLGSGFSLEQVAMVTGIFKGWVCQLRNRFLRLAGAPDPEKRKSGGRRHENMSKKEETAFLAPFFERAARGGMLVVREFRQALDAHLGRTIPLSTVYNLLHRHNWRKLAADKRHVRADTGPQADWKKIPGIARHRRQPWPGAGSLRVLFQDEARFGRISSPGRCWCPRPHRPVCRTMVTRESVYAYAAVSVSDGRLDTLIMPHVNRVCMQIFLDEGGFPLS